jgi:hypothetical protein
VLAASVILDLDVDLGAAGVVLRGRPEIRVTWPECRTAVADAEPNSETGRTRLAHWLQLRRWLADHRPDQLAARARPFGVPAASPVHPGARWVRGRVLGGTLELGIGFIGLDPDAPDLVQPVAPEVLERAGIDAGHWWPNVAVYLERMGDAAADRLRRDPTAPLRPMGDCDVVTLLGSRALRAAIAQSAAGGMQSVAIPTRDRGWIDLSRIDPAFAATAAQLTRAEDRGFERPLLVTRDEVLLGRDGKGVLRAALDGRIVPRVEFRDVLYHPA